MKLRYYAEADTDVDHRRTVELLESIADRHVIPVELVQVEPRRAPPADFPGTVEQRTLEEAWDDFTYNSTLQEGLGSAPSKCYTDPEDIVGNVGIIADGDLVWATRFWGTHHGWGPVDPEETAIGFLEAVEGGGPSVIAERVPLDDWSPEDVETDGGRNADTDMDTGNEDAASTDAGTGTGATDDLAPTRNAIREICTTQSFQRGVKYFENDRVRDMSVADNEVTATVHGSHDYRTSVDLSVEHFAPRCSCPYDYAGECKHVVAVLLAVADRSGELLGGRSDTSHPSEESSPTSTGTTSSDIERAIDEADDETMRAFLREILTEDEHRREQFLATVDRPAEKSVADYGREIERRFETVTGERGIVEYDTRLDFSQYYDRADAYRESDNDEQALNLYRALAETIRENLDRIDDSSGHYAGQIESAVDAYAATVREMETTSEERREHVDYLFEQYETTEFSFVMESYDEALRTVSETTDDLEHLRSLLEPHVPADIPVAPEDVRPGETDSVNDVAEPTDERDAEVDGTTATRIPDPTRDRLDADLFTGGALDVDRLRGVPLDIELFVGETLTEKLEALALEKGGGSKDADPSSRPRRKRSPDERTLLSTYIWVLSELDERDTLRTVLADVYTERPTFCRRYVDVLLEDGRNDRAQDVIEDGLDQFTHSPEFHRFAAEFYEGRNDERYRELLRTLFVRFEDWDAYDEFKAACSDEQWESIFHGIVTQLGRLDPDRLIDLYLYEDEYEKGLSRVLDSEDLEALKCYRDDVATLDPEAYFETYRELLEPHLANNTGRDHYRTVLDHLREMERLGFEDELDEFVAHLREKHSNRPALLDELDDAGF